MRKQNRGITLIALIITIIILLILAGITILFMLGDNGLLNRTKNAGESYSEQAARERLELALADLTAAKVTDTVYNENQYIDDNLAKQGMIVNGDIVIVDGWQFEIDRSVPKIASSIGKGKENEQIQIEASSTTSSDYVKATIQFKITYTGEISSIRIQGEEITIPTAVENVYTIDKEVTANGKYTIVVQDKEGNYQTGSIEITEITQDMEIWNKRDLETFRDNVNSGRSYEGRTVKVMADIDLEGSETNQWVPIGLTGIEFKGTFDGQGHKIKKLYIHNTYSQCGLIAYNGKQGIIQNLQLIDIIIVNTMIKSGDNVAGYTAGVCAQNDGIINNCGVTGTMESTSSATIYYYPSTGGICGENQGIISKCYNLASIKNTSQGNVQNYVGGICGSNYEAQVEDCYNMGSITHTSNVQNAYVGGICAYMGGTSSTLRNCYTIGTVTMNKGTYMGALTAINGNANSYVKGIYRNNYYLEGIATYACHMNEGTMKPTTEGKMSKEQMQTIEFVNTLGEAYTEDSNNINNGYPILKWQIE